MRKGLFNIMIANIICLVINLLTNFIIPKHVSVDTYSMIKTYALYIGYAGFFSIGYNDGMYLKYGGKLLNEIDKSELADNFINYIFMMLCMMLLVGVFGVAIQDTIIITFAVGMFAYNVLGYLKSLYQATGEFSTYGKALNIEKFSIFIFSMILIFGFKYDNYIFYVISQAVISLSIAIALCLGLEAKIRFISIGKINLKEYKENISSGFILMLGNFSSSIFTSLDRWFVKILLSSTHFAMYSFAVSMEGMINTFMTPITVSMYNFFCKKPSIEKSKIVKDVVLVWGFLVIAAAYPAKWIIENYLQNYIQANSIIFILFASQAFYVVIKGIHINIYKAQRKQHKYLRQMVIMTCISALLNIILYSIFNNMLSIATATLVTSIIWLIVCEIENKESCFHIKQVIIIIILLSSYLTTGYYLDAILGCIVYCLILLLTVSLLMNNTLKYMISIGVDTLNRIYHKSKKVSLCD